jgi:hypothetical protein
MTAVGTLRVSRDSSRQRYRVILDGVDRGEPADFAVAPGRHTVRVRIGWTGSPEVSVEIGAGQTVEVHAAPATRSPWWLTRGPRYLSLVVKPST